MIDFPELSSENLEQVTDTINQEAFAVAQKILDDVLVRREDALQQLAEKLDGLSENESLVADDHALKSAVNKISFDTRALLERVCQRIENFAIAQREAVQDVNVNIPGGTAGHRWLPLGAAGCYAPGGRYPLPSSVLMTAATARVAGVKKIWVASPNPSDVTLAAAAIAGANGVLKLGGAQAIGALAYGIGGVPRCDVVVGPGNRFVTAAKAIISRHTRIDSLAGPSELVVVAAGDDAEPRLIAADLLAQAEHDVDARPILITTDPTMVELVNAELKNQVTDLDTMDVAQSALASGGYLVVSDIDAAIQCCSQIAPEHLSLQGNLAVNQANRFESGSALFIGSYTAEVLGDYGAGPNHVLPTGGAARSQSALSVLDFMRFQTMLRIDDPSLASDTISDAINLGDLEGLKAHARSAELRL